MIEVDIKLDGVLLGRIEIKNIDPPKPEYPDNSDYQIIFRVERGDAIGAYRRFIHNFPRKKINVLGLLLQALKTLHEPELRLEREFDPDETPFSTALARQIRGTQHPF